MFSKDSEGNKDEIIEQLGQIDQWLNEIVHVKDQPSLPKAAPAPSAPAKAAVPLPPTPPNPIPLHQPPPTRTILPQTPKSSQPQQPTSISSKPSKDSMKSKFFSFKKAFSRKPSSTEAGPNALQGHVARPQASQPPSTQRSQQQQPQLPQRQPAPASMPKSGNPYTPGKLRIVPLGGLEEVGKNMMLFEYNNDIIIVDMGFQFPTTDMLGVDYVLPDVTYLIERKHKIRGVFLTHGHLDHIGAIPYLLPKLGFPPVYGAALTIGFVEKQLAEFEIAKQARLIKFDPSERLRAGVFDVSFFRVNHSIPDAVAVVIDTPCGRIVHTGDFKFDFTPADERPADFQQIAMVGQKGVAVLISDSTNALEPGHTTSEKVIAQNLDDIIRQAQGRLIITSFSSLIGRLQQVMDSSIKYKRRIFLTGRSMEMNIRIAQNLGYIKVPRGVIGDIKAMNKMPDEQVIILTTGSQGEDVSALARMATETHMKVKIQKGDTVVLSASPIPGNETSVTKVINGLCRLGAKVVTNREINIHTSGHAKQEDLKLMIKLLKPKHLIPAHGDLYMRMAHRDLAIQCGMPAATIFLMDNGDVAEGDTNGVYGKTKQKVPAGYVMVEGPERSEVAGHILMDRQLMAENGTMVVVFHCDSNYKLKGVPTIETRGFVYLDLSKKVIEEVTKTSRSSFEQYVQSHSGNVDTKGLYEYIQHTVDRLLVRMLDKRPLVTPVVVKN